ncbi:MAG: alpha/beta hydrolase [Sulfurimonas sp.]
MGKAGDVLYTSANRSSTATGVDSLRASLVAKAYKGNISDSPLADGEQLNLVGYSYGSVMQAQAALKLAKNGVSVDNLVLVGSPISSDSDLYKELSSNKNIKNIIRYDIKGDKLSNPKSFSEYISGARENTSDSGHHFDLARPGSKADQRIQEAVNTIKKQGVEN